MAPVGWAPFAVPRAPVLRLPFCGGALPLPWKLWNAEPPPRAGSGALFVGGPAELTDKILAHHEIFGFTRITIQMAIGRLDHKSMMNAIEILGTRVTPDVRKALAF